MPFQWSPSSFVSMSLDHHRWKNTLLLKNKTNAAEIWGHDGMGKGKKIKESWVSGLLLRLSWKLFSLTTCTSIYSVRFCKNLLGFLSKGFTHMKTSFHHDQAITPAHGNNHNWICVSHHTYIQAIAFFLLRTHTVHVHVYFKASLGLLPSMSGISASLKALNI